MKTVDVFSGFGVGEGLGLVFHDLPCQFTSPDWYETDNDGNVEVSSGVISFCFSTSKPKVSDTGSISGVIQIYASECLRKKPQKIDKH